MKKCRYCGHEFNELDTEFEFESRSFCSERCKNGYLETLKRRYNKQYETDDDYVECKV